MSSTQVWWTSIGLALSTVGTLFGFSALIVEVRTNQLDTRSGALVRTARQVVLRILFWRKESKPPTQTISVDGIASTTAVGSVHVEVIKPNETTEERVERLAAALKRLQDEVDQRITAVHERIDETKRQTDQRFERERAGALDERRRLNQLDARRLDLALWGLVLVSVGGVCQAISAFLT